MTSTAEQPAVSRPARIRSTPTGARRRRRAVASVIAAGAVALVGGVIGPASVAVAADAPRSDVTVYTPPAGTDGPFGVTPGPGGTYFAHGATIDRIDGRGTVTEFPVPDPATADVGWLTTARDGTIWFADRGTGRLGTLDCHGQVREFQLPAGGGGPAVPQGIVLGPGPYVWFTDQANDVIGRLSVATGAVALHQVPTVGGFPLGLVRGVDGDLYFTERAVDKVGRLTPDGTFREWNLTPGAFPNRIVVGTDHAVWFTELNTSAIARLDTHGTLTQTPIVGGPVGITLAPDGHLYTVLYTSGQLARLDHSGHVQRTWTLPGAVGALQVVFSDHALWVTDPFGDLVFRVQIPCQGSRN